MNLTEKIDNLRTSAQLSKEKGDLLAALSYLKELLELDSVNKQALNNIGNIYKEIKNFKEAKYYYSKAIHSDSNYVIAKINLAILHHDLGELKKAEEMYKEIISLDIYNFAIYFNLSRINFDIFTKEKINFIKNSLKKKKINNFNQASGYFILAKNSQINKKYEEEIEYLHQGHEYFSKSIVPKVFEENLNYWLDIISKKYNKIEILKDKKKNKENIKINPIFIIGMPRSGSTLIESIISSGKMNIPNGGETAAVNWALMKNYKHSLFEKNSKKIDVDLMKLRSDIMKKYESLSILHENSKYFFTDKSLENFFYIEILLKIFPKAKFIHCRRNNIDNIFAIYQNFLPKISWTHSLKDIITYFDNYLNIMKIFSQKFKDKILLIELEKLTTDSKKISKKMFEFCELDWTENSLEYHKRKDLFSATASNVQIREKIYKYDNSKYNVYQKHIKEFEKKYTWLKKN